MKNKLISFIVPVKRVKSRPPMFADCISSIFDKAYDKEAVEVLVGIDEEDDDTVKYVWESVPDKYKSGVIINLFKRPPSDNFTQNFYEAGYTLSDGEFIWCIGEDVDILTDNYDVKIREATVGHHNPYIIVGGKYINGLPDGRNAYCNFPLIHRNFEHEGTLLPTSINSWGVDAYFHHVFSWFNTPSYKKFNYMTTIDLREIVKIRHRSPHFGDFDKDELYRAQEKRAELINMGIAIPEEVQKSINYFYRKFLNMLVFPQGNPSSLP